MVWGSWLDNNKYAYDGLVFWYNLSWESRYPKVIRVENQELSMSKAKSKAFCRSQMQFFGLFLAFASFKFSKNRPPINFDYSIFICFQFGRIFWIANILAILACSMNDCVEFCSSFSGLCDTTKRGSFLQNDKTKKHVISAVLQCTSTKDGEWIISKEKIGY